jgi:ASC-1-like (ASCH) protein
LAPQKEESRGLKTGSLALAVREPKIFELTTVEPIEQVLRYVMLLVGIRLANLPAKEEKAILINHIQKHYSGHTVAEIRLAFEMAVNGQLPCDPVPYENFSILYFCTVMNAYRVWAAQEYRESIREEPLKQEVLTDQQLQDIHRGDIEAFYQRCRNGVVPYNTPDYFKEILVKDGLMNQDEEVSSFFVQRLGKGLEHIYLPND